MSESTKLTFTEEHQLLRQTARRFVSEHCAMDEVRRWVAEAGPEAGPGAGPEAGPDTRASTNKAAPVHQPLAAAIAEQGWLGLLIPEAHDGAGMDHMSLAVILEEVGRHLVPAPLLFHVLAGQIIAAAGSDEQRSSLLPALATGESRATVALSEPGGSWDADAIATMARPRDGGHALSGVKTHVLWGQSATLAIVAARIEGDEVALFALPLDAAGVTIEPEVSVDATRPMARITLDNVHLPADARLARGTLDEWRALHVSGYALLAAEMIGAAQRALTMTRDYANERVQFKRPIGSFQAVKHPLVDVLVALESARSLCAGAIAALDADSDHARAERETLARMAKVAANQALAMAVDRGVQLHGGYGFTWDCDMHFYYKRSLWSGATLGDALHHRRHLASKLLG